MHWADRIAKEIIDSQKYRPFWVDDMKTPSGRIHVGSLRGVVIHDLVYKGLLNIGEKAKFTFVFEDHDPMDELPPFLDKNKWSKFLGQPLFTVPSPEPGAENFARHFANEFREVFNNIGCEPEIIWTGDLYRSGRMNDGVRKCLDKADKIRQIYEETYKKKLPSDWYPFNVVCPKCGKESTTKVKGWDGQKVNFTCEVDGVAWVKGCGYTGEISPFSGEGKFVGKLPWKVEWAVKWQVIGVTVEGAGKDHMNAGGSHDIAALVCERVLGYPVPYPIAYEFFLLGGKKMSSSKGLGTSAKEISTMLPPSLLRFLFVRTNYREAINFDPVETMLIPDLFDEYDRAWQAYVDGSDENLARMFVLSQVKGVPKKGKVFLPRFRDVVNYLQLGNDNLHEKFEELKGGQLTPAELSILIEREQYARIWLDNCAPEELRVQMVEKLPERAKELSHEQRAFLKEAIGVVKEENSPEDLQTALYNLSKRLNLPSKEAFSAIYKVFIGKDFGPKAGWFLLRYPKPSVVKRLEEASK